MYTPREYGELLRIEPNYDWGLLNECATEEQVAIKALTIFLMGASSDDYDIEREIPPLGDEENEPESVDITIERMTTDEYPIGDGVHVIFDQIFAVDDASGNGEDMFRKGYFSMSVMSVDHGELGQYIFKVNPVASSKPVTAEIYAGYALDPESRVANPKHLNALSLFLDRLLLIAIRYHSRDFSEWPLIKEIEPTESPSSDS